MTEKTAETWTAIGTRVSSDGKRCAAFLDETSDERLYAERAAYALGGLYAVTVTREGKRVTRHGAPRYAGQGDATREQRAAWEAESHAAEAELERASLERKYRGDSALDELLAPLEAIAAGLRTRAARAALVGYVSERLTTAYSRAYEQRLREDAARSGREAAAAVKALRAENSRLRSAVTVAAQERDAERALAPASDPEGE